MTTVLPLVFLAISGAAAGMAICSAHIPGIRRLTGAAPLQPEDPDTARDFAASIAAGHIAPVDWGPEPAQRPRLPEIESKGDAR